MGSQDASASCLVSAHDRIMGTHRVRSFRQRQFRLVQLCPASAHQSWRGPQRLLRTRYLKWHCPRDPPEPIAGTPRHLAGNLLDAAAPTGQGVRASEDFTLEWFRRGAGFDQIVQPLFDDAVGCAPRNDQCVLEVVSSTLGETNHRHVAAINARLEATPIVDLALARPGIEILVHHDC